MHCGRLLGCIHSPDTPPKSEEGALKGLSQAGREVLGSSAQEHTPIPGRSANVF